MMGQPDSNIKQAILSIRLFYIFPLLLLFCTLPNETINPRDYPIMNKPSDGDTAEWLDFDYTSKKGSVLLNYSSVDPDSDTILYSLLFGTDLQSMVEVYQGTNNSYEMGNLNIATTYKWQLTATDQYGGEAISNGTFFTPSIGPWNTGLPPMPTPRRYLA